LLELARRLSSKDTLPHNVLLVFQPAEEDGAGAKDLCDTGILEQYHVSAIFALHLWPGLEKGKIASRAEEMLSHSCELTVDVWGKSAHISKSGESVDALAAAVEFYTRARAMEQALPTSVYRILNFGLFKSGAVRNAISGHAHLEGSLRAFQDEVFQSLYDGLFAIAKDVQASSGCRVEITPNDGYPAVMNPPELVEKVKKVVDFTELPHPFMIAEDFSWYQKRLPGMFFFLGIGDAPALHADNFDFDESILLKGADFFEHLAVHFS
jgi:hippurate hydrolase